MPKKLELQTKNLESQIVKSNGQEYELTRAAQFYYLRAYGLNIFDEGCRDHIEMQLDMAESNGNNQLISPHLIFNIRGDRKIVAVKVNTKSYRTFDK